MEPKRQHVQYWSKVWTHLLIQSKRCTNVLIYYNFLDSCTFPPFTLMIDLCTLLSLNHFHNVVTYSFSNSLKKVWTYT